MTDKYPTLMPALDPEEIATIKRIAIRCRELQADTMNPALSFRVFDIFAKTVTHEKVIAMCEELQRLSSRLELRSRAIDALSTGDVVMSDVPGIAAEAGFRVLNGEIVAADGNVSGRATDSVHRLVRLMRAAARSTR
jgi:hypothetical protein